MESNVVTYKLLDTPTLKKDLVDELGETVFPNLKACLMWLEPEKLSNLKKAVEAYKDRVPGNDDDAESSHEERTHIMTYVSAGKEKPKVFLIETN